MKLGFFAILLLLMVDTFNSFTNASLVQEILNSVKNIESLMQEHCRPNVCCSSRSRGRKEFMGRPAYGLNGHSMMKSMAPQGSVNDRLQSIDQNIANLQKMKARLEAEQPKRNKEIQGPLTKSAAGASLEKTKILGTNKNTNVNTNVNSNLSAVKKAPEKTSRAPLPTINPGILKAPATANPPKANGEKKAEKNVNANVNTNVNTVNRLMTYDLYDI